MSHNLYILAPLDYSQLSSLATLNEKKTKTDNDYKENGNATADKHTLGL